MAYRPSVVKSQNEKKQNITDPVILLKQHYMFSQVSVYGSHKPDHHLKHFFQLIQSSVLEQF